MLPAVASGAPRRIVVMVTSAAASAVALAEAVSVRHAAGLLLKIAWLYFATGARG